MWEKDINIHEVREIRTRTNVYFGVGAIKKIYDIAKDIKSKGIDKVIVMSGKNAYKATGAWDVVEKALQENAIGYVNYDQVTPNPTTVHVNDAVKLAKEFGAKAVLAIGGGSPTDAGKSVAMDTISSRSLVTKNTQSAILDIEGEYKKRVNSLSGRIIEIKQGVPAGINIFDIDVEQEENGIEKVNILNKVAEIRAILSGIMKNYMDRTLNAKELVDIEESVIETYKEKGITTNKESIYEKQGGKLGDKLTLGKIKKKMPTLSDFQRILSKKNNSKELSEILTGFLRGKSLGMFDCTSNININDCCIDFDLSSITDEVTKFYASMVITTWITEKYMRRSEIYAEKSVYIDEAWTMLKYEETANFIENLARRARKRGVRLVIATQLPEELIDSGQGRAILNCCGTAILMKQSPISVDKVIEYFKLSKGTRDFLLKARPGEALLDMEGTISAIAIEVLDKEKEMLKV